MEEVDPEYYIPRIHESHPPSGKLIRGFVSSSSATIPSKYRTILREDENAEGFLSRTKRFDYDRNVNDKPGPGTYADETLMNGSLHGQSSVSFSKRGTGTFASRQRRMARMSVTCSPGPAEYAIDRRIGSSKDFNRTSCTAIFHKPIALERQRDTGPGPSEYDVLPSQCTNTRNISAASSAFKSTVPRSSLDIAGGTAAASKVSPCQYVISDSLVHEAVRCPASSTFKSTTSRSFPPKPSKHPGPGDYNPLASITARPSSTSRNRPRRLYQPLLSTPATRPDPPPPDPGPGAYDVTARPLKEDEVGPSASFKSMTGRWTGGGLTGDQNHNLSPALYKPVIIGKQSFHYNGEVPRWV